MPVTGIESILCVQYQHFEPLLFCDSPVIIDGGDFATYYNGKDISHNLWGGEYLALAVEWKHILGSLQECHIDPLFVFSVGSEKRGQQQSYEIIGFYKKLICFKRLLHGEVTEFMLSVNPILIYSTLVDLLDVIYVSHLCSTFSSSRSCASLATRIQCPLFASSHEYLLLCAELPHLRYPGFSFMPLQCIYPKPVRLVSGTNAGKDSASLKSAASFGLVSHKFLSNNAGWGQVSSIYRPLLFLLLGTDSLPRLRLPKSVVDSMKYVEGKDYKCRRWNAILLWLGQFRCESMQAIEQIYNSYPIDERESVMHIIADCLQTYMPDNYIERRLSSILLQSPFPHETPKDSHTDQNCEVQVLDLKSMESDGRAKVKAVLLGSKFDEKLRNLDFTKSWPDELLKKFHQSKLANCVLCALYGLEGAFLPFAVENIEKSASVWDASLRLRVLHYRYLAGLELKLGQVQKLTGPMCAIEYTRQKDRLIRRRISIEPSYIKPTESTTDDILVSCLGIPFIDSLPPLDSILSLVVSLAIWYKWKLNCEDLQIPFEQSPVGLATLLCAVVNQFNFQKLDDVLVKHYEGCALFVEKDAGFVLPVKFNKSNSIQAFFSADHIHQFSAVQGVYMCLRSAVTLLDQLLPVNRRSKLLQFSPPWMIFPSGRLVHGVAASLARNTSTSRRHMCIHQWLPCLLRVSSSRAESSDLRRNATVLFEQAVNATTTLVNSAFPGFELEFNDETIAHPDMNPVQFNDLRLARCNATTVNMPEHFEPNTTTESSQSPGSSASGAQNLQFTRKKHAAHLQKNNGSVPSGLSSIHSNRQTPGVKNVPKRSTGYSEVLKKRLGLDI